MFTFPRLSRDKNGIWEPLSFQSVGFRGTANSGEGNTSTRRVGRGRGRLGRRVGLSGRQKEQSQDDSAGRG